MFAEGALAIAGVCGGTILWAEASYFRGYGFGAAAFVALAGVQSGVRALRNYNRHVRGSEGENIVIHALTKLPDDYTVVTNFVVPGTRQGDTDIIVLGPFGILAVEVKNFKGHFACHGDAWYAIRPDGTKHPLRSSVSRQTKRNRKSVLHYLIDFEIESPVYSALVFNASARLQLFRPTVPVLGPDTLADYILSLPHISNHAVTEQLEPFFQRGRDDLWNSDPEHNGRTAA